MSDFPNVDIRGLLVGLDQPVRLMSVINLSPESFYKGAVAESIDKFHEMMENASGLGADIVDIGGASTAPRHVYGTPRISVEEEIKRVSQALESVEVSKYPPISIDTTSSEVAEVALDLGAVMINDVSGLHSDSEMANLVADQQVPIVLMASCETPCEAVQASIESLKDSLRIAEEAGIQQDKIILDPGIGFGKPPEVDIAILRGLKQYTELGYPLLIGISRKAFIGYILDQPDPADRLVGSLIATAFAVMNGVRIVRTHDILETRIAIRMGEALRESLKYE
ncbi:MAG: dihydropteroate synthase [Candidatus Thorarchaeota archaeon]